MGSYTLRYPNTVEGYWSRIKRRLGGNFLNIELEEDEVADILTDGLAMISSWIPITKNQVIYVMPGQSTYPLADDMIGIDYVSYQRKGAGLNDSITSIARLTAQALFVNQAWGNFSNYYQVGAVSQYMSYYEQQSRILGTDFTWNRNGKKIEVQPTPTMDFIVVACYIVWQGLDDLEPYLQEWLFGFSMAHAKVLMGRKRSKFGDNLPVDGGMVELAMDGNKLIEEGIAEIDKYREDLIKNLSAPPRILTEDN